MIKSTHTIASIDILFVNTLKYFRLNLSRVSINNQWCVVKVGSLQTHNWRVNHQWSTVLGTENNYGIPATLMCIISDWNWSELGWWRWLVIAKPGSSTKPSSYPQPSPAPSSRQPRPRKSVIISQQQRHRPICHPPPGAGLARSGAVLTSFVDCSLQALKRILSLSLT